MEMLYLISLTVIVGVAVGALLHPDVHLGPFGIGSLGGLVVCAAAAAETGDPARATVGLAVSGAAVAAWLAGSWAWRRRTRRRRCTDIPMRRLA